jgi:hypothetical protein
MAACSSTKECSTGTLFAFFLIALLLFDFLYCTLQQHLLNPPKILMVDSHDVYDLLPV